MTLMKEVPWDPGSGGGVFIRDLRQGRRVQHWACICRNEDDSALDQPKTLIPPILVILDGILY